MTKMAEMEKLKESSKRQEEELLMVPECRNVAIILYDEFDEVVAVTVTDILRRANINVVVSALFTPHSSSGKFVRGQQGIVIGADINFDTYGNANFANFDAIVLPGGAGSVTVGTKHTKLLSLIRICNMKNKVIATCGVHGLTLLSHAGITKNKNVACGDPTTKQTLLTTATAASPCATALKNSNDEETEGAEPGADVAIADTPKETAESPAQRDTSKKTTDKYNHCVVVDGNLITACSSTYAMHLSLKLIQNVLDDQTAAKVAEEMDFQPFFEQRENIFAPPPVEEVEDEGEGETQEQEEPGTVDDTAQDEAESETPTEPSTDKEEKNGGLKHSNAALETATKHIEKGLSSEEDSVNINVGVVAKGTTGAQPTTTTKQVACVEQNSVGSPNPNGGVTPKVLDFP
eukprot:TRINITY_DN17785_c0_g1_i1.p1 TRINITY_DN17785_c0_g1~~TRINITY_DN17785_c0_g1_i1.p1  ORF type:complete len:464 (-),score=85.91 TRINITY_DN17785_c0_g1_i1:87-1301(-)